jgi:ankyrin repeat protein
MPLLVNSRRHASITFILLIHSCLVKALIDHGADVNAQDCIGNTPLHLACISGRLAIVGVLLRANATLSISSDRVSPLASALNRLQSMLNEKRTIASPIVKAEVLEVDINI